MKIVSRQEIEKIARILKKSNKKIVFTNGCFDIIHAGHIEYLREAKKLGDILILGLNSDSSVQKLKGRNRPINDENARAIVLSEFKSVDYIVIFQEDTPYDLIEIVKPDVLVKGGDWKETEIVGADIVKKYGGIVKSLEFKEGFSTTKIIEKIKKSEC